MEVKVIIPSRKRAKIVGEAAALFLDPLICVEEEEAEEYALYNPDAKLLVCPNNVHFLVGKRQWIMDNVKTDAIFQVDDDVYGVDCLTGHRQRRIRSPHDVQRIIENTAQNCSEAGTLLFGFAHTADPMECTAYHPIKLTGHVAGLHCCPGPLPRWCECLRCSGCSSG